MSKNIKYSRILKNMRSLSHQLFNQRRKCIYQPTIIRNSSIKIIIKMHSLISLHYLLSSQWLFYYLRIPGKDQIAMGSCPQREEIPSVSQRLQAACLCWRSEKSEANSCLLVMQSRVGSSLLMTEFQGQIALQLLVALASVPWSTIWSVPFLKRFKIIMFYNFLLQQF